LHIRARATAGRREGDGEVRRCNKEEEAEEEEERSIVLCARQESTKTIQDKIHASPKLPSGQQKTWRKLRNCELPS
jgi:hypothetical protein